MLLKSIDLHNIRSYDKLHLEFPSGYVLLEGDVGSGKSTILMAIEFALFGLGTVRADSLLSKRERRGEVVLAFEVDGVKYEVGRTLTARDGKVTQDPKGSYFLAGDAREPLTASDLKARVLQVLKFREPTNPRSQSRVYRYAVYTPQEEIKSILEASGREDVIRRAFGVEDYKTAADNADTLRMQIKGKKDRLTGRFAKLEAHRAEREAVGNDADELERNLARLHRTRDGLEGRLAETESHRIKMAGRMEELVRIHAEADQMERDIANKKELMKKLLENMQSDRTELDGVGERLQKLGHPVKPTGKTQGDVQKLLDMVEETERRIHAKRSEEKACIETVAGIDRKMTQLDLPTKPTGKTQGDVQKLLDMVEETERRIHAKRSEEKACIETVAGMDKELGGKSHDVIRAAIASIGERVRSGTEKLSSAEQDLREHNARIGAKRNEIKTLEDGLRKAEGLRTRCEYCGSALKPEYVVKLQSSRKDRLAVAKSELDSMVVEMMNGRQSLEGTRKQLDGDRVLLEGCRRDESISEQRNAQEARLESLRADLTSLDPETHVPASEPLARNGGEPPRDYLRRLLNSLREYESATDKITTLTQQRTRLESRIADSERGYQQDEIYLHQREASLDDARARLKVYNALEQDIRAAETESAQIRSDLEQTNSKLSVIGERIRNKKERADQLDADIKEAEGHLLQHNMYRDHEEWLKGYFVPSVCRMERYVMESLRYDFNESYGEWYSMLVDDPTKTSRIDEKFAPVLEQDGYEQNVESLSGGEKTSVALAYRLAINSTMRRQADILRSNLLILDEPTDGFSREQMEKVREILASLRSEQIIMVSHERELEGFVEHVFRVTKSEGSSSVRKIK